MTLFQIITKCSSHNGIIGCYEPLPNGDFVLTFQSPSGEINDFESLLNRYAQQHGIVCLVPNGAEILHTIDGDTLPKEGVLEFNHKPVSL
jgi:hypothetical protein